MIRQVDKMDTLSNSIPVDGVVLGAVTFVGFVFLFVVLAIP